MGTQIWKGHFQGTALDPHWVNFAPWARVPRGATLYWKTCSLRTPIRERALGWGRNRPLWGELTPLASGTTKSGANNLRLLTAPPPWMGAKLDFIFVKNILVPLCCPLGPISGKGQKTRHDLSKRLTSIHFGPLLGPALRGVVRGPPKGPG